MRTSSAKAKGRRLQVRVAEAFAWAFDLTIMAIPPTKPGKRNGVVWVAEGTAADLKVRPMGQAGPDVALLTEKARKAIAWLGHPFYVECKNVEGWSFDRMLKSGKVAPAVRAGWAQAARGQQDGANEYYPLLIIGRNQFPPFVVYGVQAVIPVGGPYVLIGGLNFLPLTTFVQILDGAREMKP